MYGVGVGRKKVCVIGNEIEVKTIMTSDEDGGSKGTWIVNMY